MSKAVILFSGGLDSTTCLALALQAYCPENVYTLSFKYGQAHQDTENRQAQEILDYYALPHKNRFLQELCFSEGLVTSALLSGSIGQGDLERPAGEPAPTYVPGRNLLFIAYGNMLAEVVGAKTIYVGVNQVDCSGYPDCSEAFVLALSNAIGKLGFGVHVAAPLATMSKADISRLAVRLNAPIHLTHSCYRGKRPACGTCDSCLLRLKGFREAGLTDTIEYAPLIG